MRTILIAIVAALFMAACAFAEPRTLFGPEVKHGGFGGPEVLYTQFAGQDGALVGGMGAWVVNETFYLGGAGYGLVTEHSAPAAGTTLVDPEYAFGYGGLVLGTTLHSDALLHLGGDLLVGGGALGRVESLYDRNHHDYHSDYHDHDYHGGDGFFVAQPQLRAEMNITSWMRLTGSVGYRYVDGVSSAGLTDDDVSGVVAGIGLRFGKW